MADLKDFPIGTHFWYLHRQLVVIAQHNSPNSSYQSIQCHYADDDGVIQSIDFERDSFDFVAELVKHSREADAAEAASRGDGW